MRKILYICTALLVALPLSAQTDKREVRRGNRRFGKHNYKEAELDYRRALVKDSTSFAATYDLASALYKQKDFEGAGSVMGRVSEAAPESVDADRYYFNSGDIALQKKDYGAAVEAFKQSLLRNPGDLQAKENYIYAKKMLENQQNQDQQNQDQNQNQNQDDQQNQQDQQPKDQPKDQPQDQQQDQPQEQKISPQQAQQMLQAIQAKEKETQDKLEKAKALKVQSRQKEKNW
ncbi:MAG: tetratricopeptide repeat protein [Bacteroidales bacterium]|nr:tetratricopeptide repeat protein [Bacteroidales bacterium]